MLLDLGCRVVDSGDYTCVASNGLDTAEFTAEVIVKGKFAPTTHWVKAVLVFVLKLLSFFTLKLTKNTVNSLR